MGVLGALLVAGTPVPGAALWQTDCTSGACRILAYTAVAPRFGPQRIAIEVDPERNVIVTALYTRARHREVFTTNPPTYVRLGDRDYVPDPHYVDGDFPVTLSVDGVLRWTLSKLNDAQFQAAPRDAPSILDAFALGTSATLTYATFIWGKEQEATISLTGFTKVLPSVAMAPSTTTIVRKPTIDPLDVIGPLIGANSFDVTPEDLRAVPNPQGEGSFVYIPKVRDGSQWLFLWFVHDEAAVKLNSTTHKLTPSLPHPRDANRSLWDDTGLSVGTVAAEGLKVLGVVP